VALLIYAAALSRSSVVPIEGGPRGLTECPPAMNICLQLQTLNHPDLLQFQLSWVCAAWLSGWTSLELWNWQVRNPFRFMISTRVPSVSTRGLWPHWCPFQSGINIICLFRWLPFLFCVLKQIPGQIASQQILRLAAWLERIEHW